ncbi:Hypothetical protein POVN_LOCUS233 [uncultured virus]|nr:Hypothetical protein POVN_LOCUS233 [uncultured virus]
MTAKSLSTVNYEFITKALGLPALSESGDKPRSKYWRIVDQDADVTLLHYEPDALPLIMQDDEFTPAEKDALLALRGTIIDTVTGRVLCRSFGYTPTVTADTLRSEGVMELKDQFGVPITIDMAKAIFQPCYEGTILRFWKWKGKVYRSTHRRIDASKSHWGSSKPFPELFADLGGPDGESLFGDEPNSNFVHVFLVSHPDLLMATKADVGDGWLLFLRTLSIYPEALDKETEMSVSWQPKLTVFSLPDDKSETLPIPPPSEGTSPLYAPTQFGGSYDTKEAPGRGIKVANAILTAGYSGLSVEALTQVDWRVRPGEALICFHGEERRMVKIESRSYNWRAEICGNNPNYLNRLYQLLNFALDPETKTENEHDYKALFPYLATPTAEEFRTLGETLIRNGPLYLPPTDLTRVEEKLLYAPSNARTGDSRDLRLRNITLCLVMAVPVHQQTAVTGTASVPGYYERLVTTRDDLIARLSKNDAFYKKLIEATEPGKRLVDNPNFGKGGTLKPAGNTLKRLFTAAHAYVSTRKAQGNVVTGKGTKMTKDHDVFLDNLRNLIKKERGPTLYSLTKAVLEPMKPRAKEEGKSPAALALPLPMA